MLCIYNIIHFIDTNICSHTWHFSLNKPWKLSWVYSQMLSHFFVLSLQRLPCNGTTKMLDGFLESFMALKLQAMH